MIIWSSIALLAICNTVVCSPGGESNEIEANENTGRGLVGQLTSVVKVDRLVEAAVAVAAGDGCRGGVWFLGAPVFDGVVQGVDRGAR